MGQAKIKNLSHSQLRKMPCVYCGVLSNSMSVDHVPPKSAFFGHRTNQLVVSACSECNLKLSSTDKIVGWLSKWFPDVPVEHRKNFEAENVSIQKNFPDLVRSMTFEKHNRLITSPNGLLIPNSLALMNLGTTFIPAAVEEFGLRYALALHWLKTGIIVPSNANVYVWWFTNFNAFKNEIPPEIGSMFPNIGPMRQGKISTVSEFLYDSQLEISGKYSAHIALFREAFAIFSVVDLGARLTDFKAMSSSDIKGYPYGIKTSGVRLLV